MILHPLQFDDLLAAVPHAGAVLEPGGRVIRVNEAWLAWWARATGDADIVGLGVNFLDACATTDGPGVARPPDARSTWVLSPHRSRTRLPHDAA